MARLHQGLMRELSEEIVAGVYAPGELLPRELDLMARFDVSRGVVREGVRALEERGLVTVKHGRGATVNEPALWDVLDEEVLDILIATGSSERLAEVLECQRMLDVQAAALAAQRATSSDLAGLEDAIRQLDAVAARLDGGPATSVRYEQARFAFHRGVVRAAGNGTLVRLSEPLHRVLASAVRRDLPPAQRVDAEMREYRAINATIAARDALQASEAMERHLDAVARDLLAD